jgi:hypothetical protein
MVDNEAEERQGKPYDSDAASRQSCRRRGDRQEDQELEPDIPQRAEIAADLGVLLK